MRIDRPACFDAATISGTGYFFWSWSTGCRVLAEFPRA
jgi:hypothetical protein